ncbi:DUF1186 domain-containing protein [Mesorhizobium sp. STM 4661]|uniref:DUF1186 domain-containing protein n=1 Tax=Mesorhizobium sp. STM 4661 TaxID=1297570 RepID=UPI0002BEC798|nr:DUF1186 domain-containing protein [Mesorhizobium sp. STM 4661]CCV10869.1 SEC-C motif domain protein [Mesorhizobium sp. STM 4661]
MKKEELEAILGDGQPDFDLGAIEHHLHAVATERPVPDVAIGLCTIRIEESAPALLAILTRAADGAALSDDEEMLLFRGLHILGGARHSDACQPLLRLLRRPDDELDSLIGDTVTETLASIVAGVFDGDVDALFGIIADRSVDEFIRDAALGAVTFLTWDGRIERGRTQQFLERFHKERLADDDDYAWIGWLEAIAMLALRDLAPLVHSAWDEGRVPSGVLDRSHFESDLLDAEQRPDDIDRFKDANLGYIDDVLVALDWTRGLHLDEDIGLDEEDWQSPWPDRDWSNITPATNPLRDIGRNDPCPCGSGKKFKKCCLAN